MLFWLLAIAVTVIACAALSYAAWGRRVNAPAVGDNAVEQHYRRQLAEIDADVASGRMGLPEREAARRELAREYLRQGGETRVAGRDHSRVVLPVSLVTVAGLAFVTYMALGRPDLPSQPWASRPEVQAQAISLEDAIRQIEQRLATVPDDLRGWSVIAPAYVELGRYTDAERAYRRVLALSPPTADAETDLAETLLAQNGGIVDGEVRTLLESAASRDPSHVRSRFYLAGEASRVGDLAAAREQWTAVLALAEGDEGWVPVARQGLAAAEAGLAAEALPGGSQPDIRGMVEGLSARLFSTGGSIEEWTQLVRSRLVLGERDLAQQAYDAAVRAFPDPAARTPLDTLARDENLEMAS